ncbi:RE1-silencing transcription factor-like [Saccostrea cucullata]|uniref:RE1-silencing transcription factor-like n=1 Tax=Saccostrea cuccullata TaxID=36930 RepID=UPI002ECFC011
MAKTKITSGEQTKKCPFCPFKTTSHTAWKDHMAECYETRHFCKKCNYSTLKKANYLRHIKRNHRGQAEATHSRDESGCKDDSEEHSSKEVPEQLSSDDEGSLGQDPDITLGEEVPDESMEGPSSSTQTQIDLPECSNVADPTIRKRTQPLPVYTPSKSKAPRLEELSKDVPRREELPNVVPRREELSNVVPRQVVDAAVQTEPVLYTKSIKTTTIMKENGRKIITVKRERML